MRGWILEISDVTLTVPVSRRKSLGSKKQSAPSFDHTKANKLVPRAPQSAPTPPSIKTRKNRHMPAARPKGGPFMTSPTGSRRGIQFPKRSSAFLIYI